jgi:hypothetical protein
MPFIVPTRQFLLSEFEPVWIAKLETYNETDYEITDKCWASMICESATNIEKVWFTKVETNIELIRFAKSETNVELVWFAKLETNVELVRFAKLETNVELVWFAKLETNVELIWFAKIQRNVELVKFATLETNVRGIYKAISWHPDARTEPTPRRMLFRGITSRVQSP